MSILLLNGSPAEISRTRALLDYLKSLFDQNDTACDIVDLKLADLPINDPEFHADAMESPDENVRNFAAIVKAADVIFLASPLYHGSYSGLLKLALDNLDGDAFTGKRIVICSQASGARNAMQAAQELVIVGRTMSGSVHERIVGTCKADYEQADDQNYLIDEKIKLRCQEIVKDVL